MTSVDPILTYLGVQINDLPPSCSSARRQSATHSKAT